MTRVLVLGSTGMLGRMVCQVLARVPSLEVEATQRRDPSEPLYLDAEQGVEGVRTLFERHGRYDYLVNTIGVTVPQIVPATGPPRQDGVGPSAVLQRTAGRDVAPHRGACDGTTGFPAGLHASRTASIRHAIAINALFPHALASVAADIHARVLHVSTDGVFSGLADSYDEHAVHDCTDVYGKTKSLGEVLEPGVLTLRCSIVGPDPVGRRGLLEWFLAQQEGAVLTGYTDALWNGLTTLQLAQAFERIILADRFEALWRESPVHHVCPNSAVSKYELLQIFATVFEKRVTIRPSAGIRPVRRVLTTRYDGLRRLVPWGLEMGDAVRALAEARAESVVR